MNLLDGKIEGFFFCFSVLIGHDVAAGIVERGGRGKRE
jgi:hypothetical protein